MENDARIYRERIASQAAEISRLTQALQEARKLLDSAEGEFIYLAKRTSKFSFGERCRYSGLAVDIRAALTPSVTEMERKECALPPFNELCAHRNSTQRDIVATRVRSPERLHERTYVLRAL
jgi:hypothetical protein